MRRVHVTTPPFAVLAIDPGAKSGWAIDGGGLMTCGVLDLERESPDAIVVDALRRCDRVVLVAERWNALGQWGASAMSGTIGAWKAWQWAWTRAGQPPRRIVRVHVSTWRAAVLGRGNLRRDQAKAIALAVAAREVPDVTDDNAAEAACIALWARHAIKVHAAASYTPRAKRAA